jgi:hypothetical protein
MLTKPEAEQRLSRHLDTLKQCISGGWDAWNTHYSSRHFLLDGRARAAIVYCEIMNLAKTLFAEVSDVKVARKRSLYVLFIGDDIVLRFKKLKNGVPANIRTDQQRLIEMQRPIPGFLPGTFVSAGYELDPLEQAISQMLVVARLGKQEKWSLDLNIGSEAIQIGSTSQESSGKKRGATARPTVVKKDEKA